MNEPLPRRAFSQRAQQSSAQADDADPLAELARIVGPDDPFHDIFGEAQRAGSKRAASPAKPAALTAVPATRPGEFDDLPLGEAFAAQHGHGVAAQQDYEAAYYDNLGGEPGYAQLPDEAEYYDDETELGPDISLKKRRGGLILAGAITLAVIGGAGYAMVRGDGGETVSGTPPVIHASTTPTKTIPEKTADAPQHSKLIYDRVGANDKPGDEKVVSRTEEPVDLPDVPADAQPAPAPAAGAPAAASVGAPDALPAQGEPRKVRTVLIRPDGSAGGDPDVGLPAMGAPQAASPPAPAQPAGYPFSIIENDPLTRPDGAGGPSQVASAPPTLVMPAPVAVAPRPTAPKPATAAAAPKPPAVVKPPVAPVASGPQRVASLPNPAGSPVSGPKVPAGGASVQLTSQRSEQDARAAFAALQKRFPGVLGSTQPSIQKADLGSRGIYYRVKVVSGTRDAAVQLCSSLKSQGGDCVVGN